MLWQQNLRQNRLLLGSYMYIMRYIKTADINVKKLTSLKLIVRTMRCIRDISYHSTKTATIFRVTLDVCMGQLMDAPCVAPSRVTQKIVAVLVEWYHRIVLTMSFKLVSFFTFISIKPTCWVLRTNVFILIIRYATMIKVFLCWFLCSFVCLHVYISLNATV